MRPSILTLVGLMVMCLLGEGAAMSEPRAPIVIEWQAPQGCPQKKDVREKIQKLLGKIQPDGPLQAEGTVTRADGRFHLELVLRAGELVGTRSIDSNSCEDLAGAAAVALGLLIHSSDTIESATPPDLPLAPPMPETERDVTIPSSDIKAPRQPERKWRILAQIPWVSLALGSVAKPSVGYGIGGGIEYANWQLQLHAIAWRAQSIEAPAYPGFGANVQRNTANLMSCRGYRASWFGFSPCLTLGFDYISASGTGKNIQVKTERSIGITGGVGVQTRIHVASWIRVLFAVEGLWAMSRPTLSIVRLGSVHQFAVVSFTSSTGIEWVF